MGDIQSPATGLDGDIQEDMLFRSTGLKVRELRGKD